MYEHILVPTDGSEEAEAATDHAIDLAAAFDATVHTLYAIEPENTTLPSEAMRHDEVYEEYVEWGEEITAAVVERAEAAGVSGVASVVEGLPHEEITEYAADHDIDLIVMGTAGRTGWRERLLGSVTEKTARISSIPVLMLRKDGSEAA